MSGSTFISEDQRTQIDATLFSRCITFLFLIIITQCGKVIAVQSAANIVT